MSSPLAPLFAPLLAMMHKEILQTVRDKRMIAILVIAPMIQLVVLGYAVDLTVDHVPTVVADLDHTAESRDVADQLLAGDTFEDVGRVRSVEEAYRAVADGRAVAALILPPGELGSGDPAALQLLVDGTDSNRAIVSSNAANAFALRRSLASLDARLARVARLRGAAVQVPRTLVEPRVLYNPTLDSATYFVPGIAATLLLVVTLIVTAMGLAREKESGTLEQVMVTPMHPAALIAGKTLPYALIGLVDLGLVLVVGAWLFEVPLHGSLLVVFVGGCLYLLTLLGLGLVVATVSRTQQQAFFAVFFFVLPAVLLSGFITPVENMPEVLQWLTLLDPVRHFVEILRANLLKAASWGDLTQQLGVLAAMGVAVFTAAVVFMRQRIG